MLTCAGGTVRRTVQVILLLSCLLCGVILLDVANNYTRYLDSAYLSPSPSSGADLEDELMFTNDTLISLWLGNGSEGEIQDENQQQQQQEAGLVDQIFLNFTLSSDDSEATVPPPTDGNSRSNDVTATKPRSDDNTTWVWLLSYQRSGSSFIGGIFTDPESVFYVYEPLDPLYSAMYGVEDGWTVPSDLLSNKDGSLRVIPQDELEASYWLMEKIYNCEMSSLPPAILSHSFWEMFAKTMSHSKPYVECLTANGIQTRFKLGDCQEHLRATCGFRFAQKEKAQVACKTILWGDNMVNGPGYTPHCTRNRRKIVDNDIPDVFKRYYECLAKLDPVLQKCAAEHFDKPCKAKQLRAIKTVRGSMRLADYLLDKHPNLKLIHLVRDPRGAVRSRSQATWSQGVYSKNSIPREAELYCSQTLSDVKRRLDLERGGYGSRIKQLVYDGFVQEPLLNTLDVYNFIGVNASMSIKSRMLSNRKKSPTKNAESIAKQWASLLPPRDIEAIMSKCAEFMAKTDYDWS